MWRIQVTRDFSFQIIRVIFELVREVDTDKKINLISRDLECNSIPFHWTFHETHFICVSFEAKIFSIPVFNMI